MFQLVSREEYIVFLGREGRRAEIPLDIVCQSTPPPVATPHLLQSVFSRHLGHSIKASYISQGFQCKYDFDFHFDQYFCHLMTHMQRVVQLYSTCQMLRDLISKKNIP